MPAPSFCKSGLRISSLFYYEELRTASSNYDPFLLRRIKGTGAPSLHTGMFVEGAEPLSPFNEHSRFGDRNLRYLRFFVVKKGS
jgi:hypothetical protein